MFLGLLSTELPRNKKCSLEGKTWYGWHKIARLQLTKSQSYLNLLHKLVKLCLLITKYISNIRRLKIQQYLHIDLIIAYIYLVCKILNAAQH